jgi:hypothetical protein
MCSDTVIAHLPTELLSEILKHVDEDTATLQNVSLTCRHLRSLAQALIFRSFVLDCMEDPDKDLLVSYESARLDFYSSDTIAPFVCEITMSLEPEYSIQISSPNFSMYFLALSTFGRCPAMAPTS